MFLLFLVYHAVFLESLSCQEMFGKVADLIKIQRGYIREVLVQGPSSIHIVLTDEVCTTSYIFFGRYIEITLSVSLSKCHASTFPP